ncbi:MAG: GNAT family N-acetyltransferase [Halobacteriota archaeon]
MNDIDALTEAWVDLADDQLSHGSTIRAAENRSVAKEAIARHVISEGLLVARTAEDAVAGFVMFHVRNGVYTEIGTRGTIANIFVHPEYRDEGIGRRLLERAEDRLRDRGVDTVTLEVLANNAEAMRFYERAGYSPHRIEFAKRFETDNNSTDHV